MESKDAEPVWELRSVASAMCVVEIVRRCDWEVSFSLPFFEGDGCGGGGNGFNADCGL